MSEDDIHYLPSAKSVCQTAWEGAKHGAGQKPRDIEDGDIRLLVAVPGVQLVDVGALQPVAEQGREVGGEKRSLEPETSIEFGSRMQHINLLKSLFAISSLFCIPLLDKHLRISARKLKRPKLIITISILADWLS